MTCASVCVFRNVYCIFCTTWHRIAQNPSAIVTFRTAVGWRLLGGCTFPRNLYFDQHPHTDFSHANLSHTNLSSHTDFSHANLSHTNLSSHTDFSHANLSHTNLSSHTDFSHANLSHTNLSSHTDFSHANLSHNIDPGKPAAEVSQT